MEPDIMRMPACSNSGLWHRIGDAISSEWFDCMFELAGRQWISQALFPQTQ
jgi:hypothetical protein